MSGTLGTTVPGSTQPIIARGEIPLGSLNQSTNFWNSDQGQTIAIGKITKLITDEAPAA